MPIVHVPQRNPGHGPWLALVRFFRFERRVGPLRLQVKAGIFELTDPDPVPAGQEIRPTGRDVSAA